MSNKIGAGQGRVAGSTSAEEVKATTQGASADVEATPLDGAPNAKRTARPKSLDMRGLGLESQLAAKLDARVAPKGTGPDPRPHAGAAAATKLEGMIGAGDATALAGALHEQISHLVTIDRREGIQLNQNATEGEINTFKVMLQKLEADGKLDDLRGALHGPSAGPRLVFGTVEDVMSKLVAAHGSKSQKKIWDGAANATPPRSATPATTAAPATGAEAKAVEDLLKGKKPNALAEGMLERFPKLAQNLMQTEGKGPKDKAEVARFKEMLGQLEKGGQLANLRAELEKTTESASLYVGMLATLINECATKSQKTALGLVR